MKILNLIKRLPIDLGQGYYRHTTKAKLMAFAAAGRPPRENNRALDFGCGDGFWSDRLKGQDWQVTSADGYDFRYPTTIEADAEKPLPFPDQSFDLVWSVEVIEHVRHVESLISEFRRILKPGGKIIITTPNSAFWLYQLLNIFGITPAQVLRRLTGINTIFHEKNTGKGGAIRTGLRHVTGDIVAIQDDDCEYNPQSLLKLIQPILHSDVQVVYGSRFLQKNSLFFIQRVENWAMTALANILLGQSLTDVETGHKVFTRAVAQKLDLQKTGFEFDMEITLQILRLGYKIKELPTEYIARSKEQGKKITYKDGLKSIATLLKYRFSELLSRKQ